jgi:3-oxoacyl-[acyl-carrier protein] reductase
MKQVRRRAGADA